jgi:biotin operon repressor
MSSEEQILKALKSAGKPMKAQEIADASGIDKKDVDKAIKKLKTEGKIKSPKVCYYSV